MNPTTEDENNIALLEPRQQPKVSDLIEAMETALTGNTDLIGRMEKAAYTRAASWAGKDGTGTKGKDSGNRPRGPWEGSSDVQVKLADTIIGEHLLMLMLAVGRSQVTAQPQEMEDTGKANLATSLLSYYFNGDMNLEVWNVIGRTADHMLHYGHSLVKVGWKETHRLVEKVLDYATLLDWARQQEQQEYAAELAALVGDAEMSPEEADALAAEIAAAGDQAETEVRATLANRKARPQLVALLRAFDPMICPGEDTRLAAALQKARESEFTYYAKEVVESRPSWRALQPMVDVFYAGLSENIQDEPFIAEVEWVTRMQLEEMAAAEGWDEAWLEKVRENPGRCWTSTATAMQDWVLSAADVTQSLPWDMRNRHYYMLTRVMYKATTKQGTTAVWETLIHEADREGYAYHRLLDGTDGQYPIVAFPRQFSRRLVDCTGIAQEVESEQQQLKSMIDSRHDRTALEVQPPVKVHWKDARDGVRRHIYPGAQFPERDGHNTGFLHLGGNGQQQSISDETLLRQTIARRFGLIDNNVPAPVSQMHMEFETTHFFKHLRALIGKTFALLQQHMDPLTGIRVSGGPEVFTAGGGTEVLDVSRDDIRGKWDFTVQFDPRDLNTEWVLERVKMLAELILPMDNMAAVDRAPLIRAAMSMLDPRLVSMVKTGDAAAEAEIVDEMSAWTAIFSGAEPPMKEGVNFRARYAFWQNLINSSPRAKTLLQQDQTVYQGALKRLKYLKQGLTQEDNKTTGRLGVAPGTSTQQTSLLGE